MPPLAARAAALLDRPVVAVAALHGGDLSQVLRLTLADGGTVIAKSGPAPETEADMLRALARAAVPVPQVLACDDTVLLLQDLPEAGGLTDPAWADLGAQLTSLHAVTGPGYGWHSDYAFGSLAIRNDTGQGWVEFWRENRLLSEVSNLPRSIRPGLEGVAGALSSLLPASPPASLLHGDLWAGNVMAANGRITALIDPACYYGDAEVDLAMLELFGQPAPAFWEVYGPRDRGWPVRRAIYQLWPAIVHLRLFGQGYLPLAERLIARIPH